MESKQEGGAREWTERVASWIPFWESWCGLSRYQEEVWENYRKMWSPGDGWKSWLPLAPAQLSQSINPWSFSLIQFTKEIKGSPVLEEKIVTEVAGYGSQIGTILDVVELLAARLPADGEGLSPDDAFKLHKLRKLADDIRKVKGGS